MTTGIQWWGESAPTSRATADDDRPGMPFEGRIRAVVRREWLWAKGEACLIWPSMVVQACLDQPGSAPSAIWVKRPETAEDFRAVRDERASRWDDRTPAERVVSSEVTACILRRSAYYTGG